jgi:hypothetical protein
MKLWCLDSDPKTRLLGRKTLPGRIVSHAVGPQRKNVVAGCGRAGLVVIDISTPRKPRSVAGASGFGAVTGVLWHRRVIVARVGRYTVRFFQYSRAKGLKPLDGFSVLERLAKAQGARKPRIPRLKALRPQSKNDVGAGDLLSLPGGDARRSPASRQDHNRASNARKVPKPLLVERLQPLPAKGDGRPGERKPPPRRPLIYEEIPDN